MKCAVRLIYLAAPEYRTQWKLRQPMPQVTCFLLLDTLSSRHRPFSVASLALSYVSPTFGLCALWFTVYFWKPHRAAIGFSRSLPLPYDMHRGRPSGLRAVEGGARDIFRPSAEPADRRLRSGQNGAGHLGVQAQRCCFCQALENGEWEWSQPVCRVLPTVCINCSRQAPWKSYAREG